MQEIRMATTGEEREAVGRLRYAVYTEELGRYRGIADHAAGTLREPEDERSWLFYATDGDAVVASTRISWGPLGFSPRQVSQYALEPFLDELPAAALAVGERAVVRADHRGGELFGRLILEAGAQVDAHDVRVVFGACEPHLLSRYLELGQRPYADRHVNSAEAGYLVPLVSFSPSPDALVGMGRRPGALPDCVRSALDHGGGVRSPALSSADEYWAEVRRSLAAIGGGHVLAFDGLTDEEIRRCVARSSIVSCRAGDRLLVRGGSARNVFVLLAGALEVRAGDGVVGTLRPGDLFGEMAFLLQRPRAFDVVVTSEASVLSLSESTVRGLLATDAVLASTLLRNVSAMLCERGSAPGLLPAP